MVIGDHKQGCRAEWVETKILSVVEYVFILLKIMIIKWKSIAPIYHVRWECRVLYSNVWMHTSHACRYMCVRWWGGESWGEGRGKHSCEKYGLELVIEQAYLEGGLKWGGRIFVKGKSHNNINIWITQSWLTSQMFWGFVLSLTLCSHFFLFHFWPVVCLQPCFVFWVMDSSMQWICFNDVYESGYSLQQY